jgi:hypothetical protein
MSAGSVVVVGVGAVVVEDTAGSVVVGAVATVVVEDEVVGVVTTVVPTGLSEVGAGVKPVLVAPAPGEATAQAGRSRARPRHNLRARLMKFLSHDGGCHP